jgi:alpha-D-xyloside xylohydrolase
VLRFFTKLKCRLMPYLYGAAIEAHKTGVPVMRAMILECPDDPGCDTLDRQYMLGDALLVAPVFSPDGMVDYYLPRGRWTNFLSGQVIDGGRWVREKHDYTSLPLMVRPNTIIPVGKNEQRPDYCYADGVTFHVFQLQDGAAVLVTVPTVQGDTAMTVEVSRIGQEIHIQPKGASKAWSVLLRGVKEIQPVVGGVAQADPLGTMISPAEDAHTIIVSLPAV